jgi:hypothetical protein
MNWRRLVVLSVGCAGFSLTGRAAEPITRPAKISLDENGVLVVDGKKVFPINLTIVPGPEAKAPNGKNAYEQFADDGCMFMRSGEHNENWPDDVIAREKALQAVAAAHGMRCAPWLGWDLGNFNASDKAKEAHLIKLINALKDSPGMGLWKGADEPEWGNEANAKKSTPEQVINVARIIHEHDSNHPVWLVQAPRGTIPSLKRYAAGLDIGGIDIYPISYPPGAHSEEKNKQISMVGDFTRVMRECAGGKPYWMTLQISFSGVIKPGKTLRFPTFPEQRFMAYEAIINGSRGLTYFGGSNKTTLNKRDLELDFNWTYWDKVMKPLLEEVGPKSPIVDALIAADSKLKVAVVAAPPPARKKATKAEEEKGADAGAEEYVEDVGVAKDARAMEFLVREVGNDVYILACKKEGPTARVKFTGLPAGCKVGEVVFEEPRTVQVEAKEPTSFIDWFGPFEVHVYKFSRGQ